MTAIPLRADSSSIRTRKLSPDELDTARKYRVGRAIDRHLRESGKNQAWLADHVGRARGNVSQWINGKQLPDFAAIDDMIALWPGIEAEFFPQSIKKKS